MPKMHIARSTLIRSDAAAVFDHLMDFGRWRPWSPWLITEPEAQLSVAADGKSYEWRGERVGEGVMKLLQARENEAMQCELNFLKPWKSTAQVRFSLEEQAEQTRVTWEMDSALPLLMFWMKNMMQNMVGMDYERGLSMLKDYIETGTVPSALEFSGHGQFEGARYIGIRNQCTLGEIGDRMAQDFTRLHESLQNNDDNITGAISIYHKFAMGSGQVDYTAAVEVKEIPAQIPTGLISGEIPATTVYSIQHTGPYRHLGNAWSALMGCNRARLYKASKAHPPFERYLNSPLETGEEDLTTIVCAPSKV